MARFLLAVWPFSGHVHPAVAIAHALRARGHDIAFYTGDAVRSIVEAEGFRLFPFKEVDEQRTTAIVSSEFPYSPSFWRRLQNARRLKTGFREWLLDTIPQQVTDIDAVLSEWRPDVLMCDLALWGPILIIHESRKLPVAVLSITAACALPGPHVPLWGFGLPRSHNAAMRFRYRLQSRLLRFASSGFRSKVNAIRRRYGLPAVDCSVTEFAGRMPLYLVPSTPEYDYNRRDLPSSVHYVGPCLWDKRADSSAPEWIAQLAADRPLIYVTEASIGAAEPFLLKAAASGLGNLPLEVVMTTGKHRNPAELGIPSAPNVRVEAYIPQSDLLPRMSVMVTLGGSGGVLAALSAGVPLVVVPTEWDRPENAQRVVEAGAGLRIPANRCTAERLRAAVNRVLAEPSFRENAHRMANDFARYGGPHRAAELLEDLTAAEGSSTDLARSVSCASG